MPAIFHQDQAKCPNGDIAPALLVNRGRPLYHRRMSQPATRTGNATTAPLVLSGVILATGALGLFLVEARGAGLFVALIETGMAWCF